MGDLFDPTALEGLRYLDLLRTQPVRPTVEAFEGYLDHPRPERKSLTDALKASKAPTGSDILSWMLSVGWVALTDSGHTKRVDITDLGRAILSVADGAEAAPRGDNQSTGQASGESPSAELSPVQAAGDIGDVSEPDGAVGDADDDHQDGDSADSAEHLAVG